jgi:uncharacterized protein (TIGR02996 family)
VTAGADERAFLWAIRERPDDDLPRLIYADWLEDGRPIDGSSHVTVPARSPQRQADAARRVHRRITSNADFR